MGRGSPVFSVSFRQRAVSWRGDDLQLSLQYFELYAYLAARRVEAPQQSGGYVDREEILTLSSWSQNSLASTGKQISRHIGQMRGAGRDLIEAIKRTTGPYRLKINPEGIRLDLPPLQLLGQLGVEDPATSLARYDDETAFRSSQSFWRGVYLFDNGKLKEAVRAFEHTMEEAPIPQWRIAASFYARRIRERWGDWDQVERIRIEREADIARCGRYESWARARDLTLDAWLEYRRRRLEKARQLYQKAFSIAQRQGYLQILGDIHNGLGEISRRSKEYPAALEHYRQALEAWMISEYFFGFQAVYFNIGAVYVQWGDDLGDHKDTVLAKQKYEHALRWTKRCKELCETLAIGYDMAEDHIQLSNIYLRLRHSDLALHHAEEAQKMARSARNVHSFMGATRVLAEIYLKKTQPEKAREAVRMAQEAFGDKLAKILPQWLR